ncbi:MAG TPA: 5-formyltetrahydrofolate cyclo-ligase [Stellaceae bacterium]|nr:5-formyltetrahydrofolate cyclo-ligase [Stellaceae bacterium]
MTATEPEAWRRRERARLLAARLAISPAERAAWTARIAAALPPLLARIECQTLGIYWPVRGEVDLRPLATGLVAPGYALALPAVTDAAAPLEYRPWNPGMALEGGRFGIPEPPRGAAVRPDVILAPLVGFDLANYRLGYGQGYFDRTLAALEPRPVAIGIGFELALVASVFPRPHDIPMDFILTEAVLRAKPAP